MRSLFLLPKWLRLIPPIEPNSSAPPADRLEAARQGLARFRNSDPEVSILLPVYNEERYLFRTLESLSRLELPWPAEIILVDNQSSDGSARLAAACGLPVFHERRQGMAYARQTGLERARGKFILSADADTLYPKDWAVSLIDVLKTQPEVSCAYSSYQFLPDVRHPHWQLAIYRFIGDPVQSFRSVANEFSNVMGFSMAYRRLDALRVGGYPDEEQMDRIGRRESEHGRIALRLSIFGKLRYIDEPHCQVWTSPRRLDADGGLVFAFLKRALREMLRPLQGRRHLVIE